MKGGRGGEEQIEMEMHSPTSLVSGFSSSTLPDEGTFSTLTVASALSITISGVTFLVGEGDLEREAEEVSDGQETGVGLS